MDSKQVDELRKLKTLLGKDWEKYLDSQRRPDCWTFFCPNCRSARKVPGKPALEPRHFFQIALTSVIFMLATWKWMAWKGIVAALPLWIGFEAYHRTRIRSVLACSHCGFDPYLYMTDVPKARRRIEEHWRRKFAEKGVPYPEPKQPRPVP